MTVRLYNIFGGITIALAIATIICFIIYTSGNKVGLIGLVFGIAAVVTTAAGVISYGHRNDNEVEHIRIPVRAQTYTQDTDDASIRLANRILANLERKE